MLVPIVLGLASVLLVLGISRRKRRLPPGPRRLPIVGNALDIPIKDPWLQFSRWSEQYGSLVYIEILRQPAVIVSSHKVAIDLMTRRARAYSDRPWNYVAKELLLGGHFMPFMDYNDRFRRLRRATQEGFRKASLLKYREVQKNEAARVATSFLAASSPTQWINVLERSAASSIMSSVYGFPVIDEEDADVQAVKQHTERIGRAIYPGAYLVDTLPWLRYLPAWLSTWHRDTRGFFAQDNKLFHRLFRSGRDNVGEVGMSFARTVAEKVDEGLVDEPDAAWLCATLFAAGAETTTATLCWFIASMAANSNVQAKAHEELDRVVGRNRLPSFDDKEKLTYLNAIINEVLRWRPPLPIGLPHCLGADDVYDGFELPGGTVCIPNVWAMNRDPEVWGVDADVFRPERQLDEEGNLRVHVLSGHDDSHASFGFGNRLCPGKHFAADTLFITCATILWAYEIRESRTKFNSSVIDSEFARTGSPLTIHPAPFSCEFTIRFPDVIQSLVSPHPIL